MNNVREYLNVEIFFSATAFCLLALGIIYVSENSVVLVLYGAFFFGKVIFYLFATTILKHSILNSSLILPKKICQDHNLKQYQENVYGDCFLSSFSFGLATPFLIKAINQSVDYAWLSRWTCLSMFFVPTTIASFIIFETLPVSIVGIILHTLPLLLVFCLIFPIKFNVSKQTAYLLLLATCNILTLWCSSTIFKISLLVTQSTIFLVIAVILIFVDARDLSKSKYLGKSKIIIKKSVLESINNTVFFVGLGVLTNSLSHYNRLIAIVNNIHFSYAIEYVMLILVILPIITIFFIHPLLLYSLLAHNINQHLIFNLGAYNTYILWVGMFIVSQLCSPASVSSILASHVEHTSIFRVSLSRHWRFCIILTLCLLVYSLAMITIKNLVLGINNV